MENTNGNTGFLIWFSNYCVGCIFQHSSKNKNPKYYLTIFHSDGTLDDCRIVNDSKFLVQAFANTVTKITGTNDSEVKYSIRFLRCYSNLSSSLKQKVLRKHKSNLQKTALARKERESYAKMEPTVKRKYLVGEAELYKSQDSAKKEKLLSEKAKCYKSLDPGQKGKLLSDKAEWYKSLDPGQKEKLLTDRA